MLDSLNLNVICLQLPKHLSIMYELYTIAFLYLEYIKFYVKLAIRFYFLSHIHSTSTLESIGKNFSNSLVKSPDPKGK